MRKVRRRCCVALIVAFLSLAGCGNGEDRPGTGSGTGSGSASGTGAGSATGAGEQGSGAKANFSKEEATGRVEAKMRDYRFEDIPATVKGPKVFFEATNDGPAEHELVVMDEHGKELGEIEAFKKGAEVKTLALELAPGRYRATCLVKRGGGTHADEGMEASFTVE